METYIDDHGRLVQPTEYPHIVRVAGLRGGRPVIEGTGYEVQHIVEYHYAVGMTPQQIAAEWDYLPLAAIFSALAYYHDHREELDRIIHESSEEYLCAQQEAYLPAQQQVPVGV